MFFGISLQFDTSAHCGGLECEFVLVRCICTPCRSWLVTANDYMARLEQVLFLPPNTVQVENR